MGSRATPRNNITVSQQISPNLWNGKPLRSRPGMSQHLCELAGHEFSALFRKLPHPVHFVQGHRRNRMNRPREEIRILRERDPGVMFIWPQLWGSVVFRLRPVSEAHYSTLHRAIGSPVVSNHNHRPFFASVVRIFLFVYPQNRPGVVLCHA